jgi:hypothetical protein
MRRFAIAVTVLMGSILIPSLSRAQEAPTPQASHAVSNTAIDQVVQQRVYESDAQRQRILGLLQRADVRALAGTLGLDLRRAESAVAMLTGQQLDDAAAQAQRVDDALAGGQSVTISTTTIIIALLVLIVLILALR